MGEPHVVSALRDKRSELAGLVIQLEKQLGQHRVNLAHIDATMRLFDPDIQPEAVRANQPRGRNEWFRPGECRRLIYDVLRDAPGPMTTREITEAVAAAKGISVGDGCTHDLITKTVLGSLNRAAETIDRVKAAGVVAWRVI
jgi:hypothetical protein